MDLQMEVKMLGLDAIKDALKQVGRDAGMVLAKTLTQTAKVSQKEQIAEMKRVFHKPVPYVLNSLFIRMATPANLASSVWVRTIGTGNAAEKFLGPQIFGGTRALKRFEKALQIKGILPIGQYAVPGPGADFDGYGNMRPSQIVQILSSLGALSEIGFKGAMSAKRRGKLLKGSKGSAGFEYVFSQQRFGKLPPGVYKKVGESLRPVLVFIRQPRYEEKTFDFHGVGEKIFKEQWDKILTEQIKYTLDNKSWWRQLFTDVR